METTTRLGTPLRHRILDDMGMRKFAEHTQAGYIRAVRKLAAFLGRPPDTVATVDLRRFQLHLVDSGTGPVTINATITGLKFFLDVTLDQPDVMAKMHHLHVPRKLPLIHLAPTHRYASIKIMSNYRQRTRPTRSHLQVRPPVC